jgi:hypothetical protein
MTMVRICTLGSLNLALMIGIAALGCATSPPPGRTAVQETRDVDGGAEAPGAASTGPLPRPPAPSRRGVIVPSDMGLGKGPAGPTTNSGTPPGAPMPGTPSGP